MRFTNITILAAFMLLSLSLWANFGHACPVDTACTPVTAPGVAMTYCPSSDKMEYCDPETSLWKNLPANDAGSACASLNSGLNVAGNMGQIGTTKDLAFCASETSTFKLKYPYCKTSPSLNGTCSLPSGSGANDILGFAYDLTTKAPQYCNGTNWITMKDCGGNFFGTDTLSGPLCFNGGVQALADGGSHIVIGGDFTEVGTCSRAGMANSSTGAFVSTAERVWSSGVVNTTVNVVIPDGNNGFYVGGDFDKIGGVTRSKLVRIKSDGTVDTTFNPGSMDGAVHALLLYNSKLYVGGSFTTITQGSVYTRQRLAAVNPTTGIIDGFFNGQTLDGPVYAMDVDDRARLFIGGSFNNHSGNVRRSYAVLDSSTGGVASPSGYSLNSGTGSAGTGIIYALKVSGTRIYVGGSFGTWGSSSSAARSNFIAANIATSNASTLITGWNAAPSDTVRTIAVTGGNVYIGGDFTSINGGTARNYLAAVSDSGTGTVISWAPSANGKVRSLFVSGSTFYAAGGFSSINSTARRQVAAIDTAGALTSWTPSLLVSPCAFSSNSSSCQANAIALSGSNVYYGGAFEYTNGITRNRIGAVNKSTKALTTWNPNANSSVTSLATSSSNDTVYAGGDFTTIGGASRNYLASLDSATGNAKSWDPSPNGKVRQLRTNSAKNRLYVVSEPSASTGFSTIAGQSRRAIVSFDISEGANDQLTSWVPAWNANANSYINDIALIGSKVIVSGEPDGSGSGLNFLWSFDNSTGAISSGWTPPTFSGLTDETLNPPFSLAADETNQIVYASNPNFYVNGNSGRNIFAFDATNGNVTNYSYGTNISGLYQHGGFKYNANKLYILGVIIDVSNGNTLNSTAFSGGASLLSGSTLYLGGPVDGGKKSIMRFGEVRGSFSQIDSTTGTVNDGL